MRFTFAAFLALIALFGCASQQQAKGPDFSDVLNMENPSGDWGDFADVDESGADSIFDNLELEKGNVTVVYFYEEGCSACVELRKWVLQLKSTYNESSAWIEYDISTGEGWLMYERFADAYGVPKDQFYVPMVYVGDWYGWGIDSIKNELEEKMTDCQQNGCYSPMERVED